MADVITRFKLETTQYDSKLRDAAKGLADYTRQATLAGNEFDKFTKKSVETAKAFGTIQTSATNSKDKVKELVAAFNDVAKAYNALTKEQQQSDFGKAMAQSMQQLKGRISEAKQEMNSTGGVMSKLAEKVMVNVDAMKLLNVGLQAAGAALDVAKDAFFASEATVDEWGRTMEASKSLYEGFLNALNTGDISGYLNNINDIVIAARAAYDELDRLSTMKTIQKPIISAQQTENDRMRQMIQTRRYIAPIDGRAPAMFNGKPMVNGQLLTDGQVRYLEQQLKGGINKMVDLVGREVKQSNKAIDALYSRFAKENGMSLKEFRQGTSSWEEFDKRMQGYSQYEKWRSENFYTDNWGNRRVKEGNPYQQYKNWGVFRVDGDKYNQELVNFILQRDQQAASVYGMQSQAYRTMNRAEGITSRIGGRGGGGGKGGSGKGGGIVDMIEKDDFSEMEELTGLINIQQQKLADLQAMRPFAETEEEIANINQQIREANDEYQRLLNLGNSEADPFTEMLPPLKEMNSILKDLNAQLENAETPEAYQNILSDIKAINAEMESFKGNPGITTLKKTGNETDNSWRGAASAISSVSSALQGIQDPSAKIAGIVGQAVANIALGFAQATTASSGAGIFGWIAAIVGGMATMLSTIETIHSATGFANGGVVKGPIKGYASGGTIDGTHYSGDMQIARVNAGETILTRAQAGNLVSQLEGNGLGNLNLSATVKGEDIRISLKNNGRRTGRGEYVTTNFRRYGTGY